MILLTKVIYYSKNNPTVPVDLTDVFSMSISKSVEIKNNIFTLVLKNLPNRLVGTDIVGQYVGNDFLITFQEEDQIDVYAMLTDDATLVGTTWWNSTNLLGKYIVTEYTMNTVENSSRLSIKSVDRAYIYFNKVWTYNYGVGNIFTTPGIFRHMLRYWTSKDDLPGAINFTQGTNYDSGIEFAVDARFISEGGWITDYRDDVATALNGALNSTATTITVTSTTGFKTSGTIIVTDGTTTEHIYYTGKNATQFTGCTRGIDFTVPVSHSSGLDVYQGFPIVTISKTWKPVFEWFGELVQPDFTNYEDEIGISKTPYFNRSFLFYIDENNDAIFLPADDDVDLDLDLGEDDFRSFNLTRSVFDAINFVVYHCGSDMYNNGVLWYYYDEGSELSTLKMRYQPFTNLTEEMVKEDLKINPTRNTTKTQDIYKQFPATYPISNWSFKALQNAWESRRNETITTQLTNDSSYNNGLRKAVKESGLTKAMDLTRGLAGLRYKGAIALRGRNIRAGDLVRVTNKYTGVYERLLRVLQVTHSISRNGFETTIDVEEDEKVITI